MSNSLADQINSLSTFSSASPAGDRNPKRRQAVFSGNPAFRRDGLFISYQGISPVNENPKSLQCGIATNGLSGYGFEPPEMHSSESTKSNLTILTTFRIRPFSLIPTPEPESRYPTSDAAIGVPHLQPPRNWRYHLKRLFLERFPSIRSSLFIKIHPDFSFNLLPEGVLWNAKNSGWKPTGSVRIR